MKLVFVYGTLKRGGSNHRFLAGQQFRGEARTAPGYTLFSLGSYPGMVRSGVPGHDVTGEVWAVDAGCLVSLDRLEGTAEGLYERVPVNLVAPFADEVVETYLYLRNVETCPPLGSTWTE